MLTLLPVPVGPGVNACLPLVTRSLVKYFMRIEQELNCSGLAFPSSNNDDSGFDEEGEDDLDEDES